MKTWFPVASLCLHISTNVCMYICINTIYFLIRVMYMYVNINIRLSECNEIMKRIDFQILTNLHVLRGYSLASEGNQTLAVQPVSIPTELSNTTP
jgi:hypothetical protein